jgi:hypothetical protein
MDSFHVIGLKGDESGMTTRTVTKKQVGKKPPITVRVTVSKEWGGVECAKYLLNYSANLNKSNKENEEVV